LSTQPIKQQNYSREFNKNKTFERNQTALEHGRGSSDFLLMTLMQTLMHTGQRDGVSTVTGSGDSLADFLLTGDMH